MLKVKKTQKVNPSDLVVNMFVRQVLDQDHVLYLADLISEGVEMRTRITVVERNGQLVILDGRHRKEAFELCGTKEVEVDVVTVADEIELISEAYRANTGGSKPPSVADTEHTIMLLLERKESMKRIAELLGLPVGLTRKYATEVKSRLNRAKMQEAVRLVTNESLTASAAAEKAGVELDKLKDMLSGKRKKRIDEASDIQRKLTRLNKSFGLQHAHMFKKLMVKFEDGDVSKKHVDDIFGHMVNFAGKTVRNIEDWQKRFAAKNGNGEGATGDKSVPQAKAVTARA